MAAVIVCFGCSLNLKDVLLRFSSGTAKTLALFRWLLNACCGVYCIYPHPLSNILVL